MQSKTIKEIQKTNQPNETIEQISKHKTQKAKTRQKYKTHTHKSRKTKAKKSQANQHT